MSEFILGEQIENVVNKKTKEYLEEVVSSFRNGNYRACVVVLYTTVIFDLLQKVIVLKEIYNDKGAKKIIENIKKSQENNPKNPEWEGKLIDDICNNTKMISTVERDELLYLKKERNYAAHPIIRIDDDKLELKDITKETSADLLKKAFEIVFLRDVILGKNIVKDIIDDLNRYYAEFKEDGLEKFLNTKYFRRMTQERKDYLFKNLWKFVFITANQDCDKNRESNYWGLVFLYNENKKHYRELINLDPDYYLNQLKLETIKSWAEVYKIKDYNDKYGITASYFKNVSRIIHFIKFIEYDPELYNCLNDYVKNILKQSIEHIYIKQDVLRNAIYQTRHEDNKLFKEQIQLKSDAIFMSDDIVKHFDMVITMIDNYITTKPNWVEPGNYCILDEYDLDIIFYQSEYRGCIEEFLKFLIKYCTGAMRFDQADYLFDYLKRYKEYYKQEHYYFILAKMNKNSQFYTNFQKDKMVNELEKMYKESFESKLIKENEEKYLYNNLYYFENENYSVEKILKLIEKRALDYSAEDLEEFIFRLFKEGNDRNFLKKQKLDDYPNIMYVFEKASKDNENYIKRFKELF